MIDRPLAELSCPNCKKRYVAGSALAGKRVRCRACAMPFRVPGAKSEATIVLAAGAVNEPPALSELHLEARFSGPPSGPALRQNSKHKFPTAAFLERWLPVAMTTIGGLWVLYETLKDHRAGPVWVSLLRLPVFLVLYIYVIVPLALLGFSRAATAMRFELPPHPKWRMAAACALPASFGYALWLVSGASGALVAGLMIGLPLTSPAFWVLLRPQNEEIGPSFAATCAGFLGGTFISGLALFVIGLFLNVAMDAYHVADRLQANPMGPSFSWNVTPVPSQPSPTTEPDSPDSSREPQPVRPTAASD